MSALRTLIECVGYDLPDGWNITVTFQGGRAVSLLIFDGLGKTRIEPTNTAVKLKKLEMAAREVVEARHDQSVGSWDRLKEAIGELENLVGL